MQSEIFKNSIYSDIKNKKHKRINLTKETQNLDTENCKIL